MNLDDIFGRLHHDATKRLEEQLASIERELNHRRLLSAETLTNLFAQLHELREEILRLQPETDHSFDTHRITRQALERDYRGLRRDVDEELIKRWNDEGKLRREHRELIAQRQALQDRYEVHGHYDSGN